MDRRSEQREMDTDSQTNYIYRLALPPMLALCVLAAAANLLVIAASCHLQKRLHTALKLTLSLALADVWTSLLIGVGLLANSYAPFVLQLHKASWHDCAGYGLEALRLGAIATSVTHLLALSFAHYAATARPMAYNVWHQRRRALHATIGALWVLPPLVFLLVFGLFPERTFNAPECNPMFLDAVGFRIFFFVVIFTPLAVMSFIYVRIAVLLKQSRSWLSSQQQSNRIRRRTRAVVTGLLIVGTFLMGWVPGLVLYAVTCSACLYPYETFQRSHPVVFFSLTICANALMIVKGLLNPLIYALRIPEIKAAVTRLYCLCWLGKRRAAEADARIVQEQDDFDSDCANDADREHC